MNALILVDLQNDFLPGGPLAVTRGDEVLSVANRLQPCFGVVVATQDWHPPDHESFADMHPGKKPGDPIELDGTHQVLWPRHCVQDTPGAQLAKQLNARPITEVVQKGTDSRVDGYSGFFDNNYRRATGLGDSLRLRGVTDVYIMGLATDYCVKHTALDARKLGFNTYLVVDGCRGVELRPGDVQDAINEMRRAGVATLNSEAVIKRLSDGEGEAHWVAEATYLRLLRRDGWEFVQRRTARGVVVVMAVTEAGRVLFVEQFRPPVNARVVEFPAGLASDADDTEDESLAEAARRELLEETGYEAATVQPVFHGPSSAGLTDELLTFYVAKDLTKAAAGGGVGRERIDVYEIPFEQIHGWIEGKRHEGCLVDARLFTGVYLLEKFLADR